MANTIGFGQGAVNNTNAWGQGAKSGSSFSNLQSIELDGIDADGVASGIDLSSATNFSISLWLKTSADTFEEFFSVWNSASSGLQLFLGRRTNNRLDIYILGAFVYKTFALNPTQWDNIVVTFDLTQAVNTDKVKAYVNGTELTGLSGSTGATSLASGTKHVYLGRRGNNYLEGLLDEVSIFNTTLSSSDVSTIYGTGTATDLSSLSPINWWRFEGTGTTATDSGSGGNDATLDNTVVRSSDVPT